MLTLVSSVRRRVKQTLPLVYPTEHAHQINESLSFVLSIIRPFRLHHLVFLSICFYFDLDIYSTVRLINGHLFDNVCCCTKPNNKSNNNTFSFTLSLISFYIFFLISCRNCIHAFLHGIRSNGVLGFRSIIV